MMGLLFPKKCILCRRVLRRTEIDLCTACRQDVEPASGKRKFQFLDSMTAIWYYEKNVRRSIVRYKFYGARYLARNFGRQLAMRVLQEDLEYDLISWVPVSRWRKFRRGYDQVELLARYTGRELGRRPLRCLKKIRNNRKQSTLRDAAQRRANVLGVYRVTAPEHVAGKKILLLDDVLTTGAIAGECARVLLTAGAKEVHCAVLAASRK